MGCYSPSLFKGVLGVLILVGKIRFCLLATRAVRFFLRRIWRSNRDVISTRKELSRPGFVGYYLKTTG
jgi:hypothetical protein